MMIRSDAEMKDSGIDWYGKAPIHWNIKPLYSCLNEINEKNAPIKTTKILSLTNTEGVIPYSERGNQGNKSKEKYEDYKVVYKDTIVANSMNILIGSVGLSKYDGCVSPVYYVYSAKDETDIRYINYLFQLELFQKRLRQFANGIMEIRLRVSSHDILHQKIACPSYEEQISISDYLDNICGKIDSIIEDEKNIVGEYKKLKFAVIFDTITKGIDKRECIDSGIEWIGQVNKHAEVLKVKYTASISRGLFNYRPRNADFLYGGNYPFIQTGDVARADKYITSYKQTLSDEGAKISKFFPKGTLTMTIAANVGDVSILDFDAYFPDSVLGITPTKAYSSEYLYYVLSAMRNELIRVSISNAQMNLNIDRVKELFVPVFKDKNAQKMIVDFLDEKCFYIDSLIEEKESLIADLEVYKKSMIYEVVTGKRKVV